MRHKKIKDATLDNLRALGIIDNQRLIDTNNFETVHLEIGTGKGQFIVALAKDFPDILFVGIERDQNAMYRLVQKQAELQLSNLMLICDDAIHLTTYFKTASIDKIYLNFSDPWPKVKHHKRRLTHPKVFETYIDLLKPRGMLQFRTDHEMLFDDSLFYLEEKLIIVSINRNLPISSYMTEYEVKKRHIGPIYQLEARKDETI